MSSISGSTSGALPIGNRIGRIEPAMAPSDELAFGADVPDVGEVADRQADRDQDQRRRLDDQLVRATSQPVSGSMK